MATQLSSHSKSSRIARWVLQIAVGLAFMAAAGAKLAGAPPMVSLFDHIGFGQWFRYLTGLVELSGDVMLLWPGQAMYGALLLTATMAGALLTHAFLIGGMWQPAAVLFVLSALLAWMNRGQLQRVR